MAAHISLLAPHLGGRAYSLRSAIVTAIGHLVAGAFAAEDADDADAQGVLPYSVPLLEPWSPLEEPSGLTMPEAAEGQLA